MIVSCLRFVFCAVSWAHTKKRPNCLLRKFHKTGVGWGIQDEFLKICGAKFQVVQMFLSNFRKDPWTGIFTFDFFCFQVGKYTIVPWIHMVPIVNRVVHGPNWPSVFDINDMICKILAGGFNFFFNFHPYLGTEMIQFDQYFSNGLKPPTRT